MATIKYNYYDPETDRNFRFIHNKEGHFMEFEDGSMVPAPRERVPLRWQWKLRDWWWRLRG